MTIPVFLLSLKWPVHVELISVTLCKTFKIICKKKQHLVFIDSRIVERGWVRTEGGYY